MLKRLNIFCGYLPLFQSGITPNIKSHAVLHELIKANFMLQTALRPLHSSLIHFIDLLPLLDIMPCNRYKNNGAGCYEHSSCNIL